MSVVGRVARAWRALEPDQRLAGVAALLLLASTFLPWYQETGTIIVNGRGQDLSNTLTAFEVYSFIEASIFLVAVGVLLLLFTRGERRAYHLPGGDGTVLMVAGGWVMFLIFYRQFDRPGGRQDAVYNTHVSVNWGIFVAFLLGALLAYAGYRIRAARIAEPPADDVAPPPPEPRPERSAPLEGQLSFDESPTAPAPAEDRPTTVPWEEPPPTRRVRRRDVFERPADPDEPSEFDPPRRRRG